jgi:hypothetical protein
VRALRNTSGVGSVRSCAERVSSVVVALTLLYVLFEVVQSYALNEVVHYSPGGKYQVKFSRANFDVATEYGGVYVRRWLLPFAPTASIEVAGTGICEVTWPNDRTAVISYDASKAHFVRRPTRWQEINIIYHPLDSWR